MKRQWKGPALALIVAVIAVSCLAGLTIATVPTAAARPYPTTPFPVSPPANSSADNGTPAQTSVLSLDGSAVTYGASSATQTISLTTHDTNDLVFVSVALHSALTSTTITSVTATGLTFHPLILATGASYGINITYAIAATAFSGTITVHLASAGVATLTAFGVNGANTASPFDPSSSSSAHANDIGTILTSEPGFNITTTGRSDMLLSWLQVGSAETTLTSPATWTPIGNQTTNSPCSGAAYEVVSAAQGAVRSLWEWTGTDATSNVVMVAVIAAGASVYTAPTASDPYLYVGNVAGTGPLAGTMEVVDSATGTILAVDHVGGEPRTVAVIPDGLYAYVTKGASVTVVSTATNAIVKNITGGGLLSGNPWFLTASHNGTYVYVIGEASGSLYVISTSTNTVVKTAAIGAVGAKTISTSPSGGTIYIGSAGNITVVNAATYAVITKLAVGYELDDLGVVVATAPAQNGSYVYAINAYANDVYVVKTASNTVVTTVSLGSGTNPNGIGITPSGNHLYIANYDASTVSVLNATTLKLAATIHTGPGGYATEAARVAFSQSGNVAYISHEASNYVTEINTATHAIIGNITGFADPTGLALTPGVPDVPVTLAVGSTPTAPNTTALSWTVSYPPAYPVSNVTVMVYADQSCSGTPTDHSAGVTAPPTRQTYTVTGLTGTVYSFEVEAWDGSAHSPLSGCVIASTIGGTHFIYPGGAGQLAPLVGLAVVLAVIFVAGLVIRQVRKGRSKPRSSTAGKR